MYRSKRGRKIVLRIDPYTQIKKLRHIGYNYCFIYRWIKRWSVLYAIIPFNDINGKKRCLKNLSELHLIKDMFDRQMAAL